MTYTKEFKAEVLAEYKQWVDEVSEACDWKTHFTADEIVNQVCDIIAKKINPANPPSGETSCL